MIASTFWLSFSFSFEKTVCISKLSCLVCLIFFFWEGGGGGGERKFDLSEVGYL